MSFLKNPFSRLKPSSQSSQYENTEMTQIFDLDSFIALVDGRNILENEQFEDQDNDDQSSISSASTTINNMNQHGVKYHYEEEEDEEDDTPFVGDEAEQSLVSGHDQNDVEGGIVKQKVKYSTFLNQNKNKKKIFIFPQKTTDRKWICMAFLLLILIFWLIWTIGLSQMGPVNGDPEQQKDTSNHIDLPDLYNSSFFVKRPTLVWVKNDPRDGIFTYTDPNTNDILLESVEDGKSEIFVQASDLEVNGTFIQVQSFEISQDAQFLLLKTNVTSVCDIFDILFIMY